MENITVNKFAPGCALMLHNPGQAAKVHDFLNKSLGDMNLHLTCCHHDPGFTETTNVINICPGCNKRFKDDYASTTTVSLWEVIAVQDNFPFPDYKGITMTILDACPTRNETNVHDAIRLLLAKMNITVVEPKKTREKGKCCGDSFYGLIPVEEVKAQMQKRADEMPVDDVVVYCVSCVKSMFIGGKKPHYLVDLLFNEETFAGTLEPDAWHKELDVFMEDH
jgi:Fe-S oxidoreductase